MKAHSFDVFDTCLVRPWARPVDVLEAAARRVAPRARPEVVSELVRRRLAAERAAQARAGTDAVTLDAIYAELGEDALHAAELAVEREGLTAVRAARERIAQARESGARILFLSDMYLPGALIREALEEAGLARPEDRLYVSGELGVSKRSGALYDHVLAAEGLTPADLVHTGDDALTDDASAAVRGIRVTPLRSAKLHRLERDLLAGTNRPRHVAARLAGVSRAVRVERAPEEGREAEATAVIASVVAPMFAAFVRWVLDTAREEGLERLYFVSRDTQVMLGIAHALRRPGDPECRYLYGSRQAWLLPGTDLVSRDALYWLLEPKWALRTPRSLLAKLGLEPGELGIDDADERLEGESLERFWELLEGPAAPAVQAKALAARELVSRYLRQEGLLGEGRWAIVDIGWRLTAQRALRRVLAHTGHEDALLGLYFGLSRHRAPLRETGPARAFLLEDDEPETGYLPEDWVFGNTSFIEQVFTMADHGSCAGYRERDGRVEPVLRPSREDPGREAYCALLHDTVAAFARAVAADGLLDGHVDDVRDMALVAGRRLVGHPERAEAAALGPLHVGDDQNETRVRRLAGPLSPADVARRTASKLGVPVTRDFGTDYLWNEGAIALTPPGLRHAFVSLRGAQGALRDGRARLRRVRGRARWH